MILSHFSDITEFDNDVCLLSFCFVENDILLVGVLVGWFYSSSLGRSSKGHTNFQYKFSFQFQFQSILNEIIFLNK